MEISTTMTPLTAGDARCILQIDYIEYELARANYRLNSSVVHDHDPTGRLLYHSFWDLVAFDVWRRTDGALSISLWDAIGEALDLIAHDLEVISVIAGHESSATGNCGRIRESPSLISNMQLYDDGCNIKVWTQQVVDDLLLAVQNHLNQYNRRRSLVQ